MTNHPMQMKIERFGIGHNIFRELYYLVLKMSWLKFVALLSSIYILINAVFSVFFLFGGDCIANIRPGSFFDTFVFSVQTFATIGYGHYLPQTSYAHLLVVVESICGVIFTALVTGLTFAKFARPITHVIFSNKAIVCNFDGSPTLIFRLGNGRETSIVDAKISVVTLKEFKTREGHVLQKFVDLKLERERSPFFLLTWSVMHKMDESSPFFGYSEEDFRKNNINLFVSLVGYDETYSHTVHTGYRYRSGEIIFSKKFVDVVDVLPDGTRRVNFEKFHEIEV